MSFSPPIIKLTVLGTFGLLASACVPATLPSLPNFSSKPIAGPAMKAAQLPNFNVGDLYYYSNGSREQIVSIEGETLNMLSRSKRKLANFRNFTLPTPYIEGKDKEYYKVSDVATNALWPLKIGNTSKFTTEGRSVSKATGLSSSYRQRWDCAVEGTERIRILAGEFDTYLIKCRRLSSNGKWWQNRTWNYSPMLGTYVLRRDFHKKNGPRVRELTAVRPSLQDVPKKVRSNVIRTWQSALESKKSGDIASWTDRVVGVSVQVEPLNTFKGENGQFCRTYKQYLTRKGVTRIYSGVACRTGKLKWRTPRRG